MASAIGTYCTTASLKVLVNIGQSAADTTDDTLLGLVCDRVNMYIESMTGRVIAPISSTTYLYDGDGGRKLFLPLPVDKAPIGGIRAITLLEVQPYTGAGYSTVTSADYFLRDRVGLTGPFETLRFSNIPTGSFAFFPRGFATVRVTGTAGWTAIPDDITEMALNLAARAWQGRQMGYQEADGGIPSISSVARGRDREILRKYTLADNLA